MAFVTYGQSGYIGSSMSVRAAEAYANGEKPLYKWSKEAILKAVREYCFEFDLKFDGSLNAASKKELVERFIEYKSWHHTGAGLHETEFYGLNEEAVCEACPELTPEEAEARDSALRDAARAREERLAHLNEREGEFRQRFGCDPGSVLAYEAFHPEMCERFFSKKGRECISYRLPAAAVAAGMKESQTASVELASGSRVCGFNAFRDETAGKGEWADLDFDEVQEKFDAVGERYGAEDGRGDVAESLDEMMSAKREEAELGADGGSAVSAERER